MVVPAVPQSALGDTHHCARVSSAVGGVASCCGQALINPRLPELGINPLPWEAIPAPWQLLSIHELPQTQRVLTDDPGGVPAGPAANRIPTSPAPTAGEPVASAPVRYNIVEPPRPDSLLAFVREFALHPVSCLEKYLPYGRPPYFWLWIWLIGTTAVLERLQYFHITGLFHFESWTGLWSTAVGLGGLVGLLMYYLMGAFFHLRAWLTGSREGMGLSLNIHLMSWLPWSAVLLISFVFETFFYGPSYFYAGPQTWLEQMQALPLLMALGVSIALGYRAVLKLMAIRLWPARLLFLGLPTGYYILLIIRAAGPEISLEATFRGDPRHDLAQVREAYREGQTREAETLLRRALEDTHRMRRVEKAELMTEAGHFYAQEQQFGMAWHWWQRAQNLYPKSDPHFLYLEARICLLHNNPDTARHLLHRVVKAVPQHRGALNTLGLLYLGVFDSAQTQLEQALYYNQRYYEQTEDPIGALHLGITHFQLHHLHQSKTWLKRVLEAGVRNAEVCYYLGRLYDVAGEEAEAVRWYRKALKLNPRCGDQAMYDLIRRYELQIDI